MLWIILKLNLCVVGGISDTDNEVPDMIPPVRIVHPAEGIISS